MALDADRLFVRSRAWRRSGRTILWLPWQASHSDWPISSKAFLCGLFEKSSPVRGMALPADRADGLDLGRDGAVVAVAVVAGRSAHVLLVEQGRGVDALLVLGELVGRDPVGLHEARVGVAAAAGLGDVPGEGRRFREFGRLDAVDAVAVGADGDLRVALLEAAGRACSSRTG